jgi:transcriptional regulator with XRE-family HTH domain
MSLAAIVPRGHRSEIAQRAKVSVSYVNQVVTGHRRPTLDVAVRLAVALRELFGVDVSVEELVRPDEPWPIDVRFLSCEPPLTDEQLDERAARRALERAPPDDDAGDCPGEDAGNGQGEHAA